VISTLAISSESPTQSGVNPNFQAPGWITDNSAYSWLSNQTQASSSTHTCTVPAPIPLTTPQPERQSSLRQCLPCITPENRRVRIGNSDRLSAHEQRSCYCWWQRYQIWWRECWMLIVWWICRTWSQLMSGNVVFMGTNKCYAASGLTL